jgi:hypothetical protein
LGVRSPAVPPLLAHALLFRAFRSEELSSRRRQPIAFCGIGGKTGPVGKKFTAVTFPQPASAVLPHKLSVSAPDLARDKPAATDPPERLGSCEPPPCWWEAAWAPKETNSDPVRPSHQERRFVGSAKQPTGIWPAYIHPRSRGLQDLWFVSRVIYRQWISDRLSFRGSWLG